MRSRQSEKERATTRPSFEVMSLRISHLRQGETLAQSLDSEDEGYVEGSEEVGVKVGKEGSLVDGDDDHNGEDEIGRAHV